MVEVDAKRVAVSPVQEDEDLEIRELQETIRDLTAENEVIQPSLNDCKARMMVEDNIKICNDRYQIAVPRKEKMDGLPNNY